MKLILLLSLEHLKLAREEALALSGKRDYFQDDNVLLLETNNDLKRLAFTRKILQHLFTCNTKDLEKAIRNFSWQRFYKKSFRVRINGKPLFEERELASIIWHTLSKPKVDLENPRMDVQFVFTDKKVYAGLLLNENCEKFHERMPHLRRGFHPTSMKPKLARALVNLSRVKKGQTLLDPFCGTGGILIEAGLIGCKLRGNDIDSRMIEYTKKNLEQFRLKAKLTRGDALKLKEKADAIVTDLPYGRCSYHTINLNTLYKRFFEKAYGLLKPGKYLVAVFPKKIKPPKSLKFENEISVYVHSGLTRHIIIAKKPSKGTA
ncbi:methyltransferase domain-containing protein [Candidatus Woesearchaeota archaeon]|nr:methyltransferase domain-containing protein [Candidatus Woesearchaeota archaeon]